MLETIPYIDNIFRSPNRFIVNEEEVVKIEQAKKITVETIKHLSKNTNFIHEGKGCFRINLTFIKYFKKNKLFLLYLKISLNFTSSKSLILKKLYSPFM